MEEEDMDYLDDVTNLQSQNDIEGSNTDEKELEDKPLKKRKKSSQKQMICEICPIKGSLILEYSERN